MDGGPTYTYLAFDRLEVAPWEDDLHAGIEFLGWHGSDRRKVWFRVDGEGSTEDRHGDLTGQVLYGRPFSPYWDLLIGAGVELQREDSGTTSRPHIAIGIQGLAPYWFEVASTLLLTESSVLRGEFHGSYDLLLTQRTVLEPEAEVVLSLRDDLDAGYGRGLSMAGAGARVRFEIRREFAPYVGVHWERRFGRSAELARDAGDPTSESRAVLGLRFWY